jgi:hypothetical protein
MRAHWLAFLTANERASRLVNLRGAGAFVESSFLDEGKLLELLKHLSASKAHVSTLTRVHFLLSKQTQRFMGATLDALKRSARFAIHREQELLHGRIQGRINWGKTASQRLSGKIPPGSFVGSVSRKDNDSAENRALKQFLEDCRGDVERAAAAVGSGELKDGLSELRRTVMEALAEPHIRAARPRPEGYLPDLQAVLRNRSEDYRFLGRMILDREALLRRNRLEEIARLLSVGWIQPLLDEDLFELYSLLSTIELFEIHGSFKMERLGLLVTGRNEVAVLRRDEGTTLRVYFDQGPNTFGMSSSAVSEYVRTSQYYPGLTDVSIRRPDLTIQSVKPDGATRVCFVELKESLDKRYIADSLYKCLAYLRDFAELWKPTPAQFPKVMLAVPSDVMFSSTAPANADLAVMRFGPNHAGECWSLLSAALDL